MHAIYPGISAHLCRINSAEQDEIKEVMRGVKPTVRRRLPSGADGVDRSCDDGAKPPSGDLFEKAQPVRVSARIRRAISSSIMVNLEVWPSVTVNRHSFETGEWITRKLRTGFSSVKEIARL